MNKKHLSICIGLLVLMGSHSMVQAMDAADAAASRCVALAAGSVEGSGSTSAAVTADGVTITIIPGGTLLDSVKAGWQARWGSVNAGLSNSLNSVKACWGSKLGYLKAGFKAHSNNSLADILSVIEDEGTPNASQREKLQSNISKLIDGVVDGDDSRELYANFLLIKTFAEHLNAQHRRDQIYNPYFHPTKLRNGAALIAWGLLSTGGIRNSLIALLNGNHSWPDVVATSFFVVNAGGSFPAGYKLLKDGLLYGLNLEELKRKDIMCFNEVDSAMKALTRKYPALAKEVACVEQEVDGQVSYFLPRGPALSADHGGPVNALPPCPTYD